MACKKEGGARDERAHDAYFFAFRGRRYVSDAIISRSV
jgi:hypothetical protein